MDQVAFSVLAEGRSHDVRQSKGIKELISVTGSCRHVHPGQSTYSGQSLGFYVLTNKHFLTVAVIFSAFKHFSFQQILRVLSIDRIPEKEYTKVLLQISVLYFLGHATIAGISYAKQIFQLLRSNERQMEPRQPKLEI